MISIFGSLLVMIIFGIISLLIAKTIISKDPFLIEDLKATDLKQQKDLLEKQQTNKKFQEELNKKLTEGGDVESK